MCVTPPRGVTTLDAWVAGRLGSGAHADDCLGSGDGRLGPGGGRLGDGSDCRGGLNQLLPAVVRSIPSPTQRVRPEAGFAL